MNRHPCWLLCICCMLLTLLTSLGVLAVWKLLIVWGSSKDFDYDAEVDSNFLGNSSVSTLWDLHKDIKSNNVLTINLFGVENPEDVLLGLKPKIKEVGPFTYKQIMKRVTLGIYEEQDTVRYKDHVEYYFQPELSHGTETDIVTIINMPWVGLAQEVSKMSAFSRFIVLAIVSRYSESVFMTRPVHEMLFGGFYHELISTFSSITGETYMPNNTFGLFYGRNDTYLDPREVNLGLKNSDKFGLTLKWKGKEELEWWAPKKSSDEWEDSEEDSTIRNECNKIKGSDWNLFHPGVKKTEELYIFADDLCRNLKFTFAKEVNDLDGVLGYRFIIPREEFADPRKNAENMCYCTQPGKDMEDCPLDGSYQINACSKGAAIFMSHPHFHEGHSSYLNNTEGLSPLQDKHQSFIDIEPVTGQVLRYSKRFQVNIHLKPLKKIPGFEKVPNLIFPVMWTDESSTISEEALTQLKSKLGNNKSLYLIDNSVHLGGHVRFLVGGVILLPLALLGILSIIRRRKNQWVAVENSEFRDCEMSVIISE